MAIDPTYEAGWQIPSGIVEAGESPRRARRGELIEFGPNIGHPPSVVHALDRECCLRRPLPLAPTRALGRGGRAPFTLQS